MGSVLTIVSKAQFEKQFPNAKVGDVLPFDKYTSTHASLGTLESGDAIFLVTVRPPNEKLWLVGVVEKPARKKDGWYGAKNTTPVADVTALKSNLVFTSGAGITAKPGALGMSLQTPRALTPADEALLRGGRSPIAAPSKAKSKSKTPGKPPFADAAGGLRWALTIAASELLQENLSAIVGDAPKALKKTAFGATYQGYMRGVVDLGSVGPHLASLAPWNLPGLALAVAKKTKPNDSVVDHLADLCDAVQLAAGVDFAKGVLALAIDRPNEVPEPVRPYIDRLDVLVDAVKSAIASGSFDYDAFDATKTLFGE